MTLGFLFCYKNFCKLLLCFLRSFCSNFMHEIRLRQWVFCTGALWFLFLWEISQFRSFGKRVSTLCLPGSLLADLGSKVIDERNWRESLHSGTLSYTRFFWTLAAIPVCLDDTVSPCLSRHTFAWHSCKCHGWWGRRAWGRLGMINFLPWRCHGCWIRQSLVKNSLINQEPRTIGTKVSVLHCIRIPF